MADSDEAGGNSLSATESRKRKRKEKKFDKIAKRKLDVPLTLTVCATSTKGVKLKHLQQLVMHNFGIAPRESPSLTLSRPVPRILAVLAAGYGPAEHVAHGVRAPIFSKLGKCFPMRVPGDNLVVMDISGVFLRPMTSEISKPKVPMLLPNMASEKSALAPQTVTVEDLILTETQLLASEYPQAGPLYIALEMPDVHPAPLYALDCEMVVTDEGRALARLSIVAHDGAVVYDELVKPSGLIRDYVTQYSGITPSMMVDVTTTLGDAHTFLLKTLPRNSILVGHSLEYDLRALKLVHRRVVDTAILYPSPRGGSFKPSLRVLAADVLGRSIQTSDLGHDSVEDARAALQLVQCRLRPVAPGSPAAGVIAGASTAPVLQPSSAGEKRAEDCCLLSCLRHNGVEAAGFAIGGVSPAIQAVVTPCANDVAAVAAAQNAMARGGFVWVRLQSVYSARTAQAGGDVPAAVTALNSHLTQLFDELPVGSLFCVIGAPLRLAGKFDRDDRAARISEVIKARQGLLFCHLKL